MIKAADVDVDRDILGIDFDLISYREVHETVSSWKAAGRREMVSITNPHCVLLCRRSAEMRRATERAGLTLPDGAGVILAARILRYPHHGRVTGPTLMLKLCDWGRETGLRHFFYGGAEGVADRLAGRLAAEYPGMEVAGTYCPPFRQLSESEDADIVAMINASRADVVWVGLGAPKQEKWMDAHHGDINATAMIGVGAAFDFHSGNVKWAPGWIRKLGLEWAHRLALDPKRMWRRNVDSPVFLMKVLWQRLTRRGKQPAG